MNGVHFRSSRMLGILGTAIGLFTSPSLFADTAPACLSAGNPIPVDDAQVLQWKGSTPNQFLARAHVSGTVNRVYPDHSGHNHFEIQIGANPTDTIEVIYNISFGALPAIQAGMAVETCGDYITSNAPAQYPASPDGAIMHWIHKNPKGHGHESGYLIVDGVLYGQGNGQGS